MPCILFTVEPNVIISPYFIAQDWNSHFKLIGDVSDIAVGAMLGQQKKIMHPIYYTSETLNEAQCNYMVTDKELLAVVFAGHFGGQRTATKVLQSGFFCPNLFKDAHEYVKTCDRCQCIGNLSNRYQMPTNYIFELELFDVWGIDFMGLFPKSVGQNNILLAVDYVSKWVEAIPKVKNLLGFMS